MEFVPTPSGGAYGGCRFEPGRAGVHLMICDPLTFPPGDLLAHLNEHVPGTAVMGGMASGERSSSPARMRSASSRVTADGAI
jgi:small ligand-binding sensory domain FIST